MKRLLIPLLLFALLPALTPPAAAQPSLCTVTGTLYYGTGAVWPSGTLEIKKVVLSGYVISTQPMPITADANGAVTFTVPRGSTAWLYSRAVGFSEKGLGGVAVSIPDAATATLESLVPTVTVPSTYAVAVPHLYAGETSAVSRSDTLKFAGDVTVTSSFNTTTVTLAAGTSTYGDSIRIADSLARLANTRVLAPLHGDSIRVADSLARLANTRVLAPLHADSIRVADSLARLARTEADAAADSARLANQRADALEAEIDTVQDAAIAALESDVGGKQAALSPEQIARIDSMLAAGYRMVITSQGRIRIFAFDSTGMFDAYGGVMAELDPLAVKDSAGLAAIADAMYLRTAPAAADTSQLVGLKRTETIFGTKTMAGPFRVTTSDGTIDTTNGVKFSLGSGRTDFLFYRGNPVAGNGAIMRFGGPYNGTQWDVTLTNNFGTIGFSGSVSGSVLTALTAFDLQSSLNRASPASGGLYGWKFTSGASALADTIFTWWYGGAPMLKLRGTATDDEALVVGSVAMQKGMKAFGRIVVQEDSVASLTGAINVDASAGNVFRGTTSGDATITLTNMVDGQSVTLWIKQGATHTLAITAVNWPAGVAPTLTAVSGKVDRFTITKSGGILRGDYVQNYAN